MGQTNRGDTNEPSVKTKVRLVEVKNTGWEKGEIWVTIQFKVFI